MCRSAECICRSASEGGSFLGDFGGAVLLPQETVFSYYEEAIAIASWGTGECDQLGAAVFMNLYSFKDWIDEISPLL